MSYLDTGYNVFLQKEVAPSGEISTYDVSSLFQGIDVSQLVSSGSLKSSDGRLAFDLDNNSYTVSDGTVERVRLGRFDDGEYGLRIQDRNGNTLLNITGTNNLIQSEDGKMQIDLTENQIRVYDDLNLRAIIGKLE